MEIQWNPISKVKLGIKSILSSIIVIFLMFEDLKYREEFKKAQDKICLMKIELKAALYFSSHEVYLVKLLNSKGFLPFSLFSNTNRLSREYGSVGCY